MIILNSFHILATMDLVLVLQISTSISYFQIQTKYNCSNNIYMKSKDCTYAPFEKVDLSQSLVYTNTTK